MAIVNLNMGNLTIEVNTLWKIGYRGKKEDNVTRGIVQGKRVPEGV
jgi:hypothetical protein